MGQSWLEFTGKITYLVVAEEAGKVRFIMEGTANISKGLLDYFATPMWETVWRIYNQYGSKVYEDSRSHSIAPFAQADSGSDKFDIAINKSGQVYTIQLYGKFAGEMRFIDQKAVDISSNTVVDIPAPVPQPPAATEPVPIPPTTLPLPKVPGDGGIKIPTLPSLAGISTGAIIALALVVFLVLRR